MKVSGKRLTGFAGVAVLAAAVLLLAASCGDENPVEPTPASPPVFRQATSLPTVTSWEKVWGLSESDVFLMGEDGRVYRNQGAGWQELNSTVDVKRTMLSAWGANADSVYFVGRVSDVEHDSSGVALYYDDPILERYNGAFFDAVGLTGLRWGLYDIWGSAGDDIFAVGYNGTILHFDGAAWSITATGGTKPVWLNSVWGSSATDVFASGANGTLLHYDGDSWSVLRSHTVRNLWDVWGLSASRVFCVGSNGTILNYDGVNATLMESPVTSSLYSVWGTAEDNVYAVGWSGRILHYDGSDWSELDALTQFGFLSIWGSAADNIYVAGEMVLHYDGVSWTPVRIRNEPDFTDVWAGTDTSWTEAVAVGTGGRILNSPGGPLFGTMTVDGGTIATDLNGVGGIGGRALFVVGDAGVILKRDAASNNNWLSEISGVSSDLNAVACLAADYAVAVGAGGTILQYDGADWTDVSGPISADLNDVSLEVVDTDTVLWVVGDGGIAWWYYQGMWQAVPSLPSVNLNSVVGISPETAYAAGDNGTLLYLSNGTWSQEQVGTSEDLTGLWLSPASGFELFVSAAGGKVLKQTGGTWTELETGCGLRLNSISGVSNTNVFVVGEYNHILRYSR